MIQRDNYMEKLKRWKDKQVIKVVTGVRRCGKSTLLKQYKEYLLGQGIKEEQCIFLLLDDLQNEALREYHRLYEYITERLTKEQRYYIFLDEIQLVPEFQKAVDSLYLKENVDIYMTGSNAYILSGELATLLSGRYVEISMLPFSFREYVEATGLEKKQAFQNYFLRGGFPYASRIEEEEAYQEYIAGIFHTVLLKDIVDRKKIADVKLLESILCFLADNIGNMVSSKKIADTLTSMGRKTTSVTVDNYLKTLQEAFVLYEAERYDVKGKQFLQSLGKYYLVDMGFRTHLLGTKLRDFGHVLENIVYLELLRRGYRISVGKVETEEVNFMVQKGDEKAYYQVAATVLDPATFEREIRPLKKITDNYPKFILSMDEIPLGEDGINQINIYDFLMEGES
ncbi:MAG: ATP-binding protein [Lachnospiraceae bacterium]|nr:ATP-binding protein [Lachnospiraceae bacterium]